MMLSIRSRHQAAVCLLGGPGPNTPLEHKLEESSQHIPGGEEEAAALLHSIAGDSPTLLALAEAVLGRLPCRVLQHCSHLKAHHVRDPTCRDQHTGKQVIPSH